MQIKQILIWLLVLAGPPLSPAISAPPAEPYGRNYLRVGASWPTEAAPVEEPAMPVDPAMAGQLRVRLNALETRDGPFSATLAEPLADLARALDGVGAQDEARAARGRAIHLIRINDGLNSPRQLPLLSEQLLADRRIGDFDSLDARYDYYFRLLGNGHPPYTPERFGATLEYLRWQREALRREYFNDGERRLGELIDTSDSLLERLESISGAAAVQLRLDATLSQLRNYYLLADRVEPPDELDDWRLGAVRRRDEFRELNPRLERLQARRQGLYAAGIDLLETLPEATSPLTSEQKALLYRELGDWAQWWGRTSEAVSHYRLSMRELESAGATELLAQWYSEPRALPDNGVFVDPERDYSLRLPVSLKVDARGRARATLPEVEEPLRRAARRLARWLGRTHFRPAFTGAEPREVTLDGRFYALEAS